MSIRFNLTPGQSSAATTSPSPASSKIRLFSFGGSGATQHVGTSASEEQLVSAAFAAAAAIDPVSAQKLALQVKQDPQKFHAEAAYEEHQVRQILASMFEVQSLKKAAPEVDGYTRYLAQSISAEERVVASGIAELNALPEAERQQQAAGLAAYAVSVASEATRDKAVELGLNRSRLELVNEVSNQEAPDYADDLESLGKDLAELAARVAALEGPKRKK